MGDIRLTEAATAVDAVVVEGERPVVKVEQGRLNYDLGRLTEGQAVNNAYEALTRLPGVSEQEGALTLAGASSVTVILNGRPSTMTPEQLAALLRSTPVDRVERAEVMFSAPPQYHVRGAAINVVLRRSHETAFSGEVHANYTNRWYDTYDAGYYDQITSSSDWHEYFIHSELMTSGNGKFHYGSDPVIYSEVQGEPYTEYLLCVSPMNGNGPTEAGWGPLAISERYRTLSE